MCINVVASLQKLRHRFGVYPINLIYRSKLHPECLLMEWDLDLFILVLIFSSWSWSFHLVPQFKTRKRTLHCTIYSLTFKLWLRSYPQVLAAFNDLSEQGFVVKSWTTLVLHAWNTRPPQSLGKVQLFYRTDLRPRLSKLVSIAVYSF